MPFKECEKTVIEWEEVETRTKDSRKTNTISAMIKISKMRNESLGNSKEHLFPVRVSKIDGNGNQFLSRHLAVVKCPLCFKPQTIFFATNTGIVKVKKCVCGGKWVVEGRGKKLYSHHRAGKR